MLRPWDRERVHQVFDTLQFRVLRDRLYQTLEAPTPEADEGFEVDAAQLGPGELAKWLAEHAAAGRIGVSVRGYWAHGTGEATEIALAAADGAGAWFDPAALDPADDAALAGWLADPERPKVMHDAKGPMHALKARGWPVAGLASDTELSAFLALPGQRSYDLADLVLRFLNRELRAEGAENGEQLSLDGGDELRRGESEAVRARAVLDLAEALDGDLERKGGRRLLDEVELPLVDVLASMERTGIAVDVDRLSALESSFGDAVKQAADDAYAAIGHEVNLGSPKQLQVVLFEDLGMPKTKRTKTGYTTDADALAELYGKTEHPFLEALLRHRDASRLRVTVEGLLKTVDDDGRIRTTFNQTIAVDRKAVVHRPQPAEHPHPHRGRPADPRSLRRGRRLRVPAHRRLQPDRDADHGPPLRGRGADRCIHLGHGLPLGHRGPRVRRTSAEVTGGMRAKIKAMNYGLAYGLSAFGLSRQLAVDVSEAQTLMNEYFERFGGVRDYLAEVVDRARYEGYTETILGRRRYLPDLTSDNRQRREMAERMALNAPMQGSAADIIKVAMLGVDRALRAEGLASRMLLQVHDELVIDVASGERDRRRKAGPARDGRCVSAASAVGRVRRHWSKLARGRPLIEDTGQTSAV